eukprot:EG_transcript_42228
MGGHKDGQGETSMVQTAKGVPPEHQTSIRLLVERGPNCTYKSNAVRRWDQQGSMSAGLSCCPRYGSLWETGCKPCSLDFVRGLAPLHRRNSQGDAVATALDLQDDAGRHVQRALKCATARLELNALVL